MVNEPGRGKWAMEARFCWPLRWRTARATRQFVRCGKLKCWNVVMADSSRSKTVTVCNRQGIHARPAHALATLASGFQAHIEIVRDGVVADGKSILAIMTLAAECGAILLLRAEGDDADQAVAALEQLILTGFGEDEDKNQAAGEHATD